MKKILTAILLGAAFFAAPGVALATSIDQDDGGTVGQVSSYSEANLTPLTPDPGMNQSIAAARTYWSNHGRTPCYNTNWYYGDLNPSTVLGRGGQTNCAIVFNPPQFIYTIIDRNFWLNNYPIRTGNGDAGTKRRANRKLCLVITHEMGHNLGWRDTNNSVHDNDPNSVMYALLDVDNATQVPNSCESTWP